MKKQHFELKTPDGECDASLYEPEHQGSFPGVLLLMDAFGPRPWLEEMAGRIADRGYRVLMPNLFYRQRHAPVLDCRFPITPEEISAIRPALMALIQGLPLEAAMRDIAVFLDFLGPRPAGVTGYCFGGRLAITAATRLGSRVAAAASFHAGGLATDAPESPHLHLRSASAELYVAHADQDASMTAEQISRFDSAFHESSARGRTELYAGALHGFTMKDLPAWNTEAFSRHEIALFELLDRNLRRA